MNKKVALKILSVSEEQFVYNLARGGGGGPYGRFCGTRTRGFHNCPYIKINGTCSGEILGLGFLCNPKVLVADPTRG